MTAAVIGLGVSCLAAGVAWTVLWFRSGVLRARRLAPVIVTLKGGDAFKGTLASSDRQALVVRNAETVGEAPIPVDGEVIVPWVDVKYLQRL